MTTSTRSSSSTTNNNSNSHNHNDSEERVGVAAEGAAVYGNNGNSPANIGSTNRVMQADEDFNIRFVNLVRTHKCLYDKKVPEYRNRDNQEKAWVLISKETRESVIHCKERWRNLRACLSRYIKQQSGSEPQHKPYYLTEHMAFLLPFLKSTRNSLDGNSSLATLFHLSQQHLNHVQQQPQHPHQTLPLPHTQDEHMYCSTASNNNNNGEMMELKHSMSENDDEETIDAFDPAVACTLSLQRGVAPATPTSHATSHHQPRGSSPARSDTASADSMQNFIPDVQLAESGPNLIYDGGRGTPPPLHYHPHTLPHPMDGHHHHSHSHGHQHQFESGSSAKRIKTECEATSTMASGGSNFYGGLSVAELADMEFFRSILPDIAALTPQQRRKFKIGILELIDDVVARYPGPERYNGGGCVVNGSGGSSSNGGGSLNSTAGRQQRRSSGREWRK